ncbi:metallophosphoesterase family protein [Alkaliphilus transvaalensis]|uniref:metallophosphoesterase family protein n=1 Tax=Alkaliphilus transvaalensis TaxID=114628 RepID=UPI0005506A5B|nr:metallophosphoesterase [Alkaliphilus transvaalensis]
MKIAIISDTHINKQIEGFKEMIEFHFLEFDMIIHAGDYHHEGALRLLQATGKFIGVWGNADSEEVKKKLNEKEIIEIADLRIGVFHGHGTKKTTIERAFDTFQEDTVDIIVFGHSHQPLVQTKKGVLMLNPGSFTNKRRERWFSYIVLEIKEGEVVVEMKFRH